MTLSFSSISILIFKFLKTRTAYTFGPALCVRCLVLAKPCDDSLLELPAKLVQLGKTAQSRFSLNSERKQCLFRSEKYENMYTLHGDEELLDLCTASLI